jgi:UDP-N-acetylglucosamine 4,6-dehydratase
MFKNKKILISGGTGSLGSQLTEKLSAENQIIVYSRNEERQFLLQKTLNNPAIRFIIGDIRDTDTLSDAMRGCNFAIHAAAMKDVIMCEQQATQCYLNNIEGSKSFIKAAHNARIEKAVAISTDKAASPSNVYGMSKYIMEKLFVEANQYSDTVFCSTRFGNMIDSSGSLITFWKNNPQLEIKITHPDMERFFFTVNDAVQTVLKTIELARNGEIFIPKMKKARIKTILQLITGKSEFETIGLFPGEKIYEELIGEHEKYFSVEFDDNYVISPTSFAKKPAGSYSTLDAPEFTTEELKQLIYKD